MSTIKNVIFDLGGVLIDWNPEYLYKKIIKDEEERKYFLDHICTMDWNVQQDAGRSIQEGNEVLIVQYPKYKKEIEAYYGRWEEMLGGVIKPTEDLLHALKANEKLHLYALTNWSAETFPIAYDRYSFFKVFEGIVVSGEEKMRKPFPEIFHLICERYHLRPEESLFIDDNEENCKAAETLGFKVHHFRHPEGLQDLLKQTALLPQ